MDPLVDIDTAFLPRPVRWFAIAGTGVLLTLLFAVWIFPYPRLARALSDRSEALVGIPLELNDLGPSIGFSGIGLAATNVRATMPRGETLAIPRVTLRPAFSFGWLVGKPRLAVDLEGGGLGNLVGDVGLGSGGGFDGTLQNIALPLLPLDQVVSGLDMEGHISGDVDVSTDEAGRPSGRVDFEAVDGVINAPGIRVGIPYKTFTGKIELGGEHYAAVELLELSGPMVYAKTVGTVAHAEVAGTEPLDMKLELRPIGQGIGPVLQQLGIEATRGQPTTLDITGTLSRPTFR